MYPKSNNKFCPKCRYIPLVIQDYAWLKNCHLDHSGDNYLCLTKFSVFYPTPGFSTVSKDKSLRVFDIASSKVKHKFLKAHEDPIYSHFIIDENLIATGDDEGRLKVGNQMERGNN